MNNCETNKSKEWTRPKDFIINSQGSGDGNPNKNGFSLQTERTSVSPAPESPFCPDGQITFREQLKSSSDVYRINETPQKMESESADPLKKYIQMVRNL